MNQTTPSYEILCKLPKVVRACIFLIILLFPMGLVYDPRIILVLEFSLPIILITLYYKCITVPLSQNASRYLKDVCVVFSVIITPYALIGLLVPIIWAQKYPTIQSIVSTYWGQWLVIIYVVFVCPATLYYISDKLCDQSHRK